MTGPARAALLTHVPGQRDIEPLMSKAITAKARSLRPGLKDAKHLIPADTGILLDNLQGTRHEVRMGYEDVASTRPPGPALPSHNREAMA